MFPRLALVTLFIVAAPIAASAWEMQRACLAGSFRGDGLSMAVDAEAAVHLLAIHRVDGHLDHVRVARDGSTRRTRIADRISRLAIDQVDDTGLALEGARPWACYYNAAAQALEVAWQAGAGWGREVVTLGEGAGRRCAIAVRGGAPSVAFSDDAGVLRFATRLGRDRWQVEVVDAPPGLPVGEALDLGWIEGPGWVIAHQTADARLRITWFGGDRWRSHEPPGPDVPAGASPAVVDAGGGDAWIAHGGFSGFAQSDGGLFLTRGAPGEMGTGRLDLDDIGGSLGAARLGDRLMVATRLRRRSAVFGASDALRIYTDVAGAAVISEVELAGAGAARRVYQRIALGATPLGAPVIAALEADEPQPGQFLDDRICVWRPLDTDGDGLGDVGERRLGLDPADPDTDGDGADDGLEFLSQGSEARAPTIPLPEPRRYGAAGCRASAEQHEGEAVLVYGPAARAGCQYVGLEVEPGVYRLRFDHRVDAGTLRFWFGLGDSNTPATVRYQHGDVGGWQASEVIVRVPPGAGDLRLIWQVVDGEARVAGPELIRLDPLPLLPGGHFEDPALPGWRRYGPAGCAPTTTHAWDGGGSLWCRDGEKMQQIRGAAPPGRYLLTGAAMVSGRAIVRVGDGSSNEDLDAALSLPGAGGWQTFARPIVLPRGSDDLRVVLIAEGEVRFDALRLRPVLSEGWPLAPGVEGPDAGAWVHATGRACAAVADDRLEGEALRRCGPGVAELRQRRVPVVPGRVYRYAVDLHCLSGACAADVLIGNRPLTAPALGPWPEPLRVERLFRVPAAYRTVDLRASVIDGEALVDAFALSAVGPGDSLVINGDFEAPVEAGWRRYGPAGCAVVEGDPWDGARALRCVDQAAQQVGLPAEPGRRYRLSWYRRGAGALELRVGDRSSNADFTGAPWRGQALADRWTLEDRIFTWPAGASGDDLRIVLRATGAVHLDAMHLRALPAGDSLIVNGDFEAGTSTGWLPYGAPICEGAAAAAFSGVAGMACEEGPGGVQQMGLPLAAGRRYRLRYAYRVGGGLLEERLGVGTSNLDFEGAGLLSGPTDDWQQRDRVFDLPAGFQGDARLVFRVTGAADVDDVTLTAP